MNDQQDPFAAHPYVPPAQRSGIGTETVEPEASTSHTDDSPDPSAVKDPNDISQSPPAAAAAEDATQIPTAPRQSMPEGAEQPGQFTHRYPDLPHAGSTAPPSPPEPPMETANSWRPDPSFGAPESSEHAAFGHEPTTTLPPGMPPTDPPSAPPATAPERRPGRLFAGALALVLLAGGAGFAGGALSNGLSSDSTTTTSSTGTSTGTALDNTSSTSIPAGTVEQVAETVLPSVVQINFRTATESGSGTGVILSEDGQILTNNHVIEAAAETGTITVSFSDGTNTTATVLGQDVATDVAVIQAAGVSGLTPATLGVSSELRVGQEVVAIGSPFGLESTVTQGIVSALNRPVSPGEQSSNSTTLTTFPAIQTDAAINPGNSGGPLVNLAGEVIGINSAIRSSGYDGGSIGLGFAIPIDLARNVATQILNGDTVEHARIGVRVESATDAEMTIGIGARVSSVDPGGAGEAAGLQAGDIVTAIDGHAIANNEALIATIRGYQPGDDVDLTVLRGEERLTLDVTLGSDQGQLNE